MGIRGLIASIAGSAGAAGDASICGCGNPEQYACPGLPTVGSVGRRPAPGEGIEGRERLAILLFCASEFFGL